MGENNQQATCKNFFKNEPDTRKIQFTKKWIELINKLERNKSIYIEKQ